MTGLGLGAWGLGGRRGLVRGGSGLLLGGAVLLGGCGDLSGPEGGIEGTYEMMRINGEAPPVDFEQEVLGSPAVVTVVSGTLQLSGGRYTQTWVAGITVGGESFEPEEFPSPGDYSVDGALITFDPDEFGQPTFTGTVQGRVIETTEDDPEFGTITIRWEK